MITLRIISRDWCGSGSVPAKRSPPDNRDIGMTMPEKRKRN
jgi:hypothetical protein